MRNLGIILIVTFFYSCTIKPAKIEYGTDACHFCKMNIVDKMYAAQIVTKKGKAFKYDAIECLLNDLESKDQNAIKLFLITDYNHPPELIDATKATYLISESIQSPMGGNLSGFSTKQEAIAMSTKNADGKIYDWQGILNLYHKN